MADLSTPQPPQELPPNYVIFQMACGYWVSQTLYVAAKLGIADLVATEPKSAEDLAQQTETHAPTLYRILRALASVGVFAEDDQHRFGLTPLAECLLNKPGSQRSMVLMMGEEHYRAYGQLMYCLKNGKSSFEYIYGQSVFDYLGNHPEKAVIFDDAMTGIHGQETAAMIDAYDFSGINTIVDVGGGNGTVIKAVLEKYPQMKGILYDLKHVVIRAKIESPWAFRERCEMIAGSFFESIPEGGDAYMMRHIIHDWDDEKCLTILRNCRKVMKPGSRLLVIDAVIAPGNARQFSKFLDITMLVIPSGKERTESEFRSLFQSAGFELTRIIPTRAEVCIIEGRIVE